MSKYIVLENFNDMISIVTDKEGNNKEFDTYEEARKEADECHNGHVVKVDWWKDKTE